jgi:hypothetical protein
MVVISEPLVDIAGASVNDPVVFWTEVIRENDAGTGVVTTRRHSFAPVNGVLTAVGLEAGPAKVKVGGKVYGILIPDTDTTIRLWPLIEAGLPVPDPSDASFVRNANNVRRIADVYESDFAALTPDPDTVYLVFEG